MSASSTTTLARRAARAAVGGLALGGTATAFALTPPPLYGFRVVAPGGGRSSPSAYSGHGYGYGGGGGARRPASTTATSASASASTSTAASVAESGDGTNTDTDATTDGDICGSVRSIHRYPVKVSRWVGE